MDRAPQFEDLGVAIVGASFDTPEDNKIFSTSHGFPFPLLSDVDRAAGAEYETLRAPEEVMPEWAKRRTFLIDPEGVIRKVSGEGQRGAPRRGARGPSGPPDRAETTSCRHGPVHPPVDGAPVGERPGRAEDPRRSGRG